MKRSKYKNINEVGEDTKKRKKEEYKVGKGELRQR